MMLLELHNIKKHFPVKAGFLGKTRAIVRAVDDVTLTQRKGEHIGLVGESGCGKTTLARLMMRLYKADSGSMILEGKDIFSLSERDLKIARKDIQMVFQDPYSSLDPRYTIRNILKEAIELDRAKFHTPQKQEQRMEELMRAVQLSPDMLNRFPHEFSGGERQRVAIARALMFSPKLLILDEAVSSLDVLIQNDILHLLKELQKSFDVSYMFISHNLKVVKKISHRIAVMYQGKIVEVGPTETILNKPLHPYTQELLEAAIYYRSPQKRYVKTISSRATWRDQGDGHQVLMDE